jgi:hypothetical protein
MRNLLALNWSSSAEHGGDREANCNGKGGGSCAGGSLKRSLLQLPPRDPKLVKSSASRGSWPGPGVSPGSVASFLASELSKSEQHLSIGRRSHSHSHSGDMSSSNTASTVMTDAGSSSSFSAAGECNIGMPAENAVKPLSIVPDNSFSRIRPIFMVPERILFQLWLSHLLFSRIHCFFFRPLTKTMNRGFTV